MKTIQAVTFFGSSLGDPGDPNFDAARKTAKAVAEAGLEVVDGGGPGTMRAATQGAKLGHGKSTVVYYEPELATSFEGESDINKADRHFQEGNYIERTRRLLELGDAYIIFNGGTGTISEFGMAWGLAKLYFGHHKPLILYGYFWHYIIQEFHRRMKIRPQEMEVFTIVTKPEEAMEAIAKYDEILKKNRHEHKDHGDGECHLLL